MSTSMPVLRKVLVALIASVTGIACTFGFLALTEPLASLPLDTLAGIALFGAGGAAGLLGAKRLRSLRRRQSAAL